LRPWTRSRAQQVLHQYQLEQIHPSHTGMTHIFLNVFHFAYSHFSRHYFSVIDTWVIFLFACYFVLSSRCRIFDQSERSGCQQDWYPACSAAANPTTATTAAAATAERPIGLGRCQ